MLMATYIRQDYSILTPASMSQASNSALLFPLATQLSCSQMMVSELRSNGLIDALAVSRITIL